MRPTLTDRDNAAAVADFNARVTRRANALATVLVALGIGVALALALLHYWTPCPAGTLCATLAMPWPAGALRRACRRLHRRVHMRVLRVRVHQLLRTAVSLATDERADHGAPLAAVLDRAATLQLQLRALEHAERAEQLLRAVAPAR